MRIQLITSKFLVFLLLVSINSFSQKYLERFSNSVGVIEYYDSLKSPAQKHIGTGTIIYKPIRDNYGNFFIVTNRHNMPMKGMSRNIYFKLKKGDNISFETIVIPIFDDSWNLSAFVKFGLNNTDIALLDFSQAHRTRMFNFLDTNLIRYETLATTDTLLKYNIAIGHEVYFLGYPSAFYDKRNTSPILRTGIISTKPSEDFYFNDDIRMAHFSRYHEVLPEKFNGFLIDANVVGGSSGSLVFLKPQPFPLLEDGKPIPVINIPFILGIVSDSYFDLGALDVGHTRLNLGGVISSNVIKEAIDAYYK